MREPVFTVFCNRIVTWTVTAFWEMPNQARSKLESRPEGALPILMRWRRILPTSTGSVMTVMSYISDPHCERIRGLSL